MITMELKDKCKFIRKELELTQRQFAVLIQTNQTEVSFIERGFIPENKIKIKMIDLIYQICLTYKED